MITDKELDAIIDAPRPRLDGHGVHSLYTCYVAWDRWRGMEKKRMMELFERIRKTEFNRLREEERDKLDQAIHELRCSTTPHPKQAQP